MKKILTLSILLLSLSISQLLAQDIYEVNVSKNLNVRKLPSANAAIVGSLANGTLVEVFTIDDSWAEINYKNQKAYISSKYINLKIKVNQEKTEDEVILNEVVEDSISIDSSTIVIETKKKRVKQRDKDKKNTSSIISRRHNSTNKLNNWAFDFVPSAYVGISDFTGDYVPVPQCGWGTDFNFQIYNIQEKGFPKGYLAETSVGYAMKGGGGFVLNYFTLHLLPLGYRYEFDDKWTLGVVSGLTMGFGGGSLYAHSSGVSKNFYGYPFDLGIQLKIAAEYRKFGLAVSYDQGVLDAVEPYSMTLLNWGVNIHFYYRLWDLTNNKIYRP